MNILNHKHLKMSCFFLTNRENGELVYYFTKEQATDQKYYDLLNFRKIGEKEYQLRISYFILKLQASEQLLLYPLSINDNEGESFKG